MYTARVLEYGNVVTEQGLQTIPKTMEETPTYRTSQQSNQPSISEDGESDFEEEKQDVEVNSVSLISQS